MQDLILEDTIAAISTPIGKSGIGLVRLSGKEALAIADRLFVGTNGLTPSQFPSHTLHYGWIVKKAKLKTAINKGELIDEVLLTVMRAPKTYTREDIVEINCHSGIVVLKKILELVLSYGVRLAKPGEFTKRAYLNGRIDLAQAEAVLDVINSQTRQALSLALGQLQGRLSAKIRKLRQNLLAVLTQLELGIDFSDQDVQLHSAEELLKKITQARDDLGQLLATADRGTMLRQGLSCVICGRPNVGKSSLLNALLKKERAIVTPLPGTTRDSLEESVDLGGIPLRLIDTAGIVQGRDLAEQAAVDTSRRQLKQADFVLLVLDITKGIAAEDLSIFRDIAGKPAFLILNKRDLPAKISIKQVERLFPGRKALAVSALVGTGLDRLERDLSNFFWQGRIDCNQELLIANIRHAQALTRARSFLKRAIKLIKQGHSPELISLEVKEAQASLSEIIGKISSQDVLERIFSQFCIGK